MAKKVLERERKNKLRVALRDMWTTSFWRRSSKFSLEIKFKFFEVPVFCEMTDFLYEFGGSRAKQCYGSFGVVSLTSASAMFFFAKKVYDGRSPGSQCSQGKDLVSTGVALRVGSTVMKALETAGQSS